MLKIIIKITFISRRASLSSYSILKFIPVGLSFEIDKYRMDLVGVQEVRWEGSGTLENRSPNSQGD